MKYLGEIVEDIRQNQNISIANLCEGIISDSTYSRFIRGKTNLASDSFIRIIGRLNMSFEQFLYQNLNIFQLNYDYTVLNHAQLINDSSIVDNLISTYQLKKNQMDWRACDERFLTLLYFLQGVSEPASQSKLYLKTLVESLHSLKSYTSSDFIAIKLLLAYLESEEAEALVQRVLKETADNQDPIVKVSTSDLCAMIFIKKLLEKQTGAAYKYYCLSKLMAKEQSDFRLKITIKIIDCLHLYLYEKQEASIEMFEELVVFLNDLSLPLQGRALIALLTELGIPLEERNFNYADQL